MSGSKTVAKASPSSLTPSYSTSSPSVTKGTLTKPPQGRGSNKTQARK